MSKRKILFIDRDGTLLKEPEDQQIDSLEKFEFEPHVIPSLLTLKKLGYMLVIITNQDGLNTDSFPYENFEPAQTLMLKTFLSQGINITDILVCPHFEQDHCNCRKPKLGLVKKYLQKEQIDFTNSAVIGDRSTDIELAENMAIQGILYHRDKTDWKKIVRMLSTHQRTAEIMRTTKETQVSVNLDLDKEGNNEISTGIGFFDHMLDQIATHGGFHLALTVKGDLHIDDHHTIEDTALALGQALHQALGDKRGINRFGFTLPMDECLAQCTLDLSGRPYLMFNAKFNRDKVGDFSTEMVKHFFYSITNTLACTLHLSTSGENAHHMIESLFKAFGRSLRQAFYQAGNILPSSKGVL